MTREEFDPVDYLNRNENIISENDASIKHDETQIPLGNAMPIEPYNYRSADLSPGS